MSMSSISLLHRIRGWKGSLENQYCNSLLKSGSSTADSPGSYLMKSCLPPRTETSPLLGNMLQCSTPPKLRFSLCLNANSCIHFMPIASCPVTGQNRGVGFLFTPSHRVCIHIGKTFKAKQSQLCQSLFRTDASSPLSSLQPFTSLTSIYSYFLTLGSCFAPGDAIFHESSKKRHWHSLRRLFKDIYVETIL